MFRTPTSYSDLVFSDVQLLPSLMFWQHVSWTNVSANLYTVQLIALDCSCYLANCWYLWCNVFALHISFWCDVYCIELYYNHCYAFTVWVIISLTSRWPLEGIPTLKVMIPTVTRDFQSRNPDFQSQDPNFETWDPELQSWDPDFQSWDPEIKNNSPGTNGPPEPWTLTVHNKSSYGKHSLLRPMKRWQLSIFLKRVTKLESHCCGFSKTWMVFQLPL